MSSVSCWECGKSYSWNEVFDIPVFRKGWTVKWCFNCAMKQLALSDYRIVPKPDKYKNFRIKSIEDDEEEIRKFVDELILCFEAQIRKLKEIDNSWGDIQQLAIEIQQEGRF